MDMSGVNFGQTLRIVFILIGFIYIVSKHYIEYVFSVTWYLEYCNAIIIDSTSHFY